MSKLRILLIGGHPADTFDVSGGTLAHHIQRGDKVTVVSMTHGARTHSFELLDEVKKGNTSMKQANTIIIKEKEKKQREVQEACGILGISDVRFMDYDDPISIPDMQIIHEIDEIIRETKPHILITHYPLERAGVWGTHSQCGQMVMKAQRTAIGARKGTNLPHHHIAQIFFMNLPGEGEVLDLLTPRFMPVYIDISDVIEKKIEAMDKLASQHYSGAYNRKLAETYDGSRGSAVRVNYAETFLPYYPDIYQHLPVSQVLLDRAANTLEHMLSGYSRIVSKEIPPIFE
jgi:LmbE family N-acetylglucosaminyl deacetylase